MKSIMLRMTYGSVLLGFAGFVTVGPYGAWPAFDADEMVLAAHDIARAFHQPVEAVDGNQRIAITVATPIRVTGDCARPDCTDPSEATIAVSTPAAPQAVVLDAVSTVVATSQTASIVEASPATGAPAPVAATSIATPTKPVAKAGDAIRTAAQANVAAVHRAKEVRAHIAASRSAERPRTVSDWAVRQVFNRGG